jgi:hypothetical protein
MGEKAVTTPLMVMLSPGGEWHHIDVCAIVLDGERWDVGGQLSSFEETPAEVKARQRAELGDLPVLETGFEP